MTSTSEKMVAATASSNEKKPKVVKEKRSLLKQFSVYTSLHGLAHIPNSSSVFIKVFWSLILFVTFAGLCLVVSLIIEQFLNDPTATSFKITGVNEVNFPQVTVCNHQPFSLQKMKDNNVSKELAEYMLYIFTFNMAWEFNRANDFYSNGTWHFQSLEDELQKLIENKFAGDFRQLIFAIGPECELQFEHCKFKLEEFSCCKVAQVVFHPIYGKCFLFNLKQSQTWPNIGLDIKTTVNPDNYLVNPRLPLIGLGVAINHKWDPSDFGIINVGPGFHSTITLQETTLQRTNNFLKQSCINGDSEISHTRCTWACVHVHSLMQCGCSYAITASSFPRFADVYNLTFFPVCTPKQTIDCLNPTAVAYKTTEEYDTCAEGCLPDCIRVMYAKRHSFTKLAPGSNESSVSFSVFFDVFDITKIVQIDTMTSTSVIANIGGAMGVFCGASFITIVELLMFVLTAIVRKTKVLHQKVKATASQFPIEVRF